MNSELTLIYNDGDIDLYYIHNGVLCRVFELFNLSHLITNSVTMFDIIYLETGIVPTVDDIDVIDNWTGVFGRMPVEFKRRYKNTSIVFSCTYPRELFDYIADYLLDKRN